MTSNSEDSNEIVFEEDELSDDAAEVDVDDVEEHGSRRAFFIVRFAGSKYSINIGGYSLGHIAKAFWSYFGQSINKNNPFVTHLSNSKVREWSIEKYLLTQSNQDSLVDMTPYTHQFFSSFLVERSTDAEFKIPLKDIQNDMDILGISTEWRDRVRLEREWCLELPEALLYNFLAPPLKYNTLEQVDLRRSLDGDYKHSLGSPYMAHTPYNQVGFSRHETCGIYGPSRTVFALDYNIVERHNEHRLVMNDRFHCSSEGKVKPNARDAATTMADKLLENWLSILNAVITDQQDSLQKALWRYFAAGLFLSHSLGDPSGLSTFLVSHATHFDAALVKKLNALISDEELSVAGMGEYIQNPDMFRLPTGFGAFLDANAPMASLLGSTNDYSRLLPIVTVDWATLKAKIQWPYMGSDSGRLDQAFAHIIKQRLNDPLTMAQFIYVPSYKTLGIPSNGQGVSALTLAIKLGLMDCEFALTGETRVLHHYAPQGEMIWSSKLFAYCEEMFPTGTDKEARQLQLSMLISNGFIDAFLARFPTLLKQRRSIDFWATYVIYHAQQLYGKPSIVGDNAQKQSALEFLLLTTQALQKTILAGEKDIVPSRETQRLIETYFGPCLDPSILTEELEADFMNVYNFWTRRAELDPTAMTGKVTTFWKELSDASTHVGWKNFGTLPSLSSYTAWREIRERLVNIEQVSMRNMFANAITFATYQPTLTSLAMMWSPYNQGEIFVREGVPAEEGKKLTTFTPWPNIESMRTWLKRSVCHIFLPPMHEDDDTEATESIEHTLEMTLHQLMLLPQNQLFMLYLSNGMFSNAYQLVVARRKTPGEAVFTLNNNNTPIWKLDQNELKKNEAVYYIQDLIWSWIVVGLDTYLKSNDSLKVLFTPGSGDALARFFNEVVFSIPYNTTNPPKRLTKSSLFGMKPGALTLLEAARIGNPKIFELLCGKFDPLDISDIYVDEWIERTNATPIHPCYFQLPDPFCLMTPRNALELIDLIDSKAHEYFGQAHIRKLIEQTVPTYPEQRNLEYIAQERMDAFAKDMNYKLQSYQPNSMEQAYDIMLQESSVSLPHFYDIANLGINHNSVNDYVLGDVLLDRLSPTIETMENRETLMLELLEEDEPPVQEPLGVRRRLSFEETSQDLIERVQKIHQRKLKLKMAQANGDFILLLNLAAQSALQTDPERLVLSHRRLWNNFMSHCYKEAKLIPKQVQLSVPVRTPGASEVPKSLQMSTLVEPLKTKRIVDQLTLVPIEPPSMSELSLLTSDVSKEEEEEEEEEEDEEEETTRLENYRDEVLYRMSPLVHYTSQATALFKQLPSIPTISTMQTRITDKTWNLVDNMSEDAPAKVPYQPAMLLGWKQTLTMIKSSFFNRIMWSYLSKLMLPILVGSMAYRYDKFIRDLHDLFLKGKAPKKADDFTKYVSTLLETYRHNAESTSYIDTHLDEHILAKSLTLGLMFMPNANDYYHDLSMLDHQAMSSLLEDEHHHGTWLAANTPPNLQTVDSISALIEALENSSSVSKGVKLNAKTFRDDACPRPLGKPATVIDLAQQEDDDATVPVKARLPEFNPEFAGQSIMVSFNNTQHTQLQMNEITTRYESHDDAKNVSTRIRLVDQVKHDITMSQLVQMNEPQSAVINDTYKKLLDRVLKLQFLGNTKLRQMLNDILNDSETRKKLFASWLRSSEKKAGTDYLSTFIEKLHSIVTATRGTTASTLLSLRTVLMGVDDVDMVAMWEAFLVDESQLEKKKIELKQTASITNSSAFTLMVIMLNDYMWQDWFNFSTIKNHFKLFASKTAPEIYAIFGTFTETKDIQKKKSTKKA